MKKMLPILLLLPITAIAHEPFRGEHERHGEYRKEWHDNGRHEGWNKRHEQGEIREYFISPNSSQEPKREYYMVGPRNSGDTKEKRMIEDRSAPPRMKHERR